MKKVLFLACGIAMLMTSCAVPSVRSTSSASVYSDYSINAAQRADIRVSEKRESFVYLAPDNESIAQAKNNARYDLLEKFQADVLVEPRYEVIDNNGRIKVTVSGRIGWLEKK